MRYETDNNTSKSEVSDDDGGDDYGEDDNSTSNSGVRVPVNDDILKSGVDDKSTSGGFKCVNAPFYRLDSDLGDAPYWNNGTLATDRESCRSYGQCHCNV